LPCDLPLVSHADLTSLAAHAHAGQAAIAPDRRSEGTNGLCLPASATLEFAFGPHSFQRHLSGLQQLGLAVHTVERLGFQIDVDTPQDLAQLSSLGASRLLPREHDTAR
jgi:2-phospho-L-lactate guanylyltransferase